MPRTSCRKYAPTAPTWPYDAGLDLAGEEAVAADFRRAASFPRHTLANEIERASGGIALRIQSHLAQEREHVHRGIPARFHAVPAQRPSEPGGRAARARAFGCDPRALGDEVRRARIRQVAQRLPADRRIGFEQPGNGRAPRWRGAVDCVNAPIHDDQ
jgi:hypothetical protein